MTSGPPTASTTPVVDRPDSPLRLRLKPVAPPTGHVDGAWWPGSRDLVAELPGLAAALADRLGVVSRVVFAHTFWGSAPERIELNGRTVVLLGLAAMDTDVVQVASADQRHIDLLVIPPDADAPAADRALTLAASSDHTRLPARILAAAGVATTPPPRASTHRTLRRTHVGSR